MTKRINVLVPVNGGIGIGLMTPGAGPYSLDDGLADELVNRRVATYADAQVPPTTDVVFIAYYTLAQFAQLTEGAAGLTYEISDAPGRPQYRWDGSAFVQAGGGGASGLTAVSFSALVPLDSASGKSMTLDAPEHDLSTGNAAATPNASTAVPNGYCQVIMRYDGTHTYDISAFTPGAAFTPSVTAGSRIMWEFVKYGSVADYLVFGTQLAAFVAPPAAPTVAASSQGPNFLKFLVTKAAGQLPTQYVPRYKPAGAADSAYVDLAPVNYTGAVQELTIVPLDPSTEYDYGVIPESAGGAGTPSAVLTNETAPPAQITFGNLSNVTTTRDQADTFDIYTPTDPGQNMQLAFSNPGQTGGMPFDQPSRVYGTIKAISDATGIFQMCADTNFFPAMTFYQATFDFALSGNAPPSQITVGGTLVDASLRAHMGDLIGFHRPSPDVLNGEVFQGGAWHIVYTWEVDPTLPLYWSALVSHSANAMADFRGIGAN